MAATLEELEMRLAALERRFAVFQERQLQASANTLPDFGSEMIREARSNQQEIDSIALKLFADMGIAEEPVDVARLRVMMRECGIRDEDRSASREIIAMRDE
jgi:hypothetical protein